MSISRTEKFAPIHDSHAIDRVAFVVQFDRPFDAAIFKQISDQSDKLKGDFPRVSELQSANVRIDGNNAITQRGESAGILGRKFSPDGAIESELSLERSSFAYLTTSYTRWKDVLANFNRYLSDFLPMYLSKDAQVISVSLTYIDKFKWIGSLEKCDPGFLFKEDSKYLCKHIFETKELWHSHTGAFIRSGIAKRLLNINVDSLDEAISGNNERIVSITTVLTDQFNQPGYDPHSCHDINDIDSHMQSMHDFGKEVLENLITEEMSRKIALYGQEI